MHSRDTCLDGGWQLKLVADELVQHGEGCTGLAAEVPDRRYALGTLLLLRTLFSTPVVNETNYFTITFIN